MKKKPMLNKFLSKRLYEEENAIMFDKIQLAKTRVDKKCPESFNFFKSNFNRERKYDSRENEVNRRNEILINKIKKIYLSNKSPYSSKPLSAQEKSKKLNICSDKRKNEILTITQENQSLYKRIYDSQPIYNHVKMEKDYSQARYYMKNICEFQLLPFEKTAASSMREFKQKTEGRRAVTQQNQKRSINSIVALTTPKSEDDEVEMYSKKIYILEYGMCNCLFSVVPNKFTITIKPFGDNPSDKIFKIIITSKDEVEKLQKAYYSYEQIINDIAYINGSIQLYPNILGILYDCQEYLIRD